MAGLRGLRFLAGVGGNCSFPLGLQDGRILDSQLTASSSYEQSLGKPHIGLLVGDILNLSQAPY
jgi:hypothetical protein